MQPLYVDLAFCSDCPRPHKAAIQHTSALRLLQNGLLKHCRLELSMSALEEEICRMEHGKPYLKSRPDIHYNISHCDGLTACAFFSSPIGIDVENLRPFRNTVVSRVLTPSEQSFLHTFDQNPQLYNSYFFRFWTLKESYMKQTGRGLIFPPAQISFDLTDPEQISCSKKGFRFAQQMIADQYVLSVCSREPFQCIISFSSETQ